MSYIKAYLLLLSQWFLPQVLKGKGSNDVLTKELTELVLPQFQVSL